MIDFHSHILPEIDDGSSSVEMSMAMLEESARRGVSVILATPHYYADRQRPEEFLTARWESYERLTAHRRTAEPRILLGAEVYYFEGMSHAQQMHELCIRGSDLLLLEMPFVRWTQRMIEELLDISYRQDLTVILAHIERYMEDQPEGLWKDLQREGVLTQVNASFFIRKKTRRKALSLLERGEIDLLGSDCHNMTSRLPNMGEAMQVVGASLGRCAESALVDRGRELLLSHRISEPQA